MKLTNEDTVGETDIGMCLDCSMSGYSNQGRPYCTKEKRHLDSFSYIPDWCLLKTICEIYTIWNNNKITYINETIL